MKRAIPLIVLGLWQGLGTAADEDPVAARFKVPLFPEAGYVNERMTFVVEAATNSRVVAEFNGKPLTDAVVLAGRHEFNLRLEDSGLLLFRQATNAIAFHVVQPADPVRLREEAGYLYSDKAAAILMARHLFPPKHDRTWEAARLVRWLFSDRRPEVRTGTLVAAAAVLDGSGPPGDGKPSKPGAFWTCPAVSNCQSEINGFITTGAGALKATDVLLLVLSGKDLEQGVNPVEFRAKLEWYLQSLAPLKFGHTFVALPTLSALQQERSSGTLASVRIAVLGNRGSFLGDGVPRRGTGGAAPADWLPLIEKQISDTLRIREP